MGAYPLTRGEVFGLFIARSSVNSTSHTPWQWRGRYTIFTFPNAVTEQIVAGARLGRLSMT
jgi:hypothetical protein